MGRRGRVTTKTLRHEEDKKREEISNFKLQISKGKFWGEEGAKGVKGVISAKGRREEIGDHAGRPDKLIEKCGGV